MVVTGPDEYGSCHNAVVVVALYCAHLFAVLFELVEVELECGGEATLYVKVVAQCLDKEIYYHRLGRGVGVEPPTARTSLSYLLLRGAAVEVAVLSGNLI